MSTEKKIAANRANAKRSTGPRTKKGKARTSRNALRHGLAVSPSSDPILSAAAARLRGRFITHEDIGQPSAGIAAEATAELFRIRAARTQILKESGDLKDVGAISNALRVLLKTDRYERRELSRLKTGAARNQVQLAMSGATRTSTTGPSSADIGLHSV